MTMEWYPWYYDDFRRDTLHLSLAEDGAYRRMIDEYMRNQGPIPDDDRVIARLLGISHEEWSTVAKTVRSFFRSADGKLHHKRCDIEIAEQSQRITSVSKQRKTAAKARWKNKKQLTPGRTQAVSEPQSGDDADRMRERCGEHATRQDRTRQDKEESSSSAREAEPEKPAAVAIDERLKAAEAILEVLGVQIDRYAQTWSRELNTTETWLNAGYDLAAEIIPAVQSSLARQRLKSGEAWCPGSFGYFTKAIEQAHRERGQSIAPAHDAPAPTSSYAERLAAERRAEIIKSRMDELYKIFGQRARGMITDWPSAGRMDEDAWGQFIEEQRARPRITTSNNENAGGGIP